MTTLLLRMTEAGTKLLHISGAGAVSLQLAVAGDLNHDGRVDGADNSLYATQGADLNGDGAIDSTDRQVLYANQGFRANEAPVGISNALLKTHTDLTGSTSLDAVARDNEGDSLFWRLLGSTHGTATLAADGVTLIFTPEAGYSGPAVITLQADDGYTASQPIEVAVNVSNAKLLMLHVPRVGVLKPGNAAMMHVTGDFEDEAGVSLSAGYLQFVSSDPNVIAVGSDGIVRAGAEGKAILTVRARGIEGVNVFTVDANGFGPIIDSNGIEVDVYPRAINLPIAGQRQLKVTTYTGSNISDASKGTRYFISDSSIAEITADGLVIAKAVGTALISVINDGMQQDILIKVQLPEVGPSTVSTGGAVAQNAEGDLLMVPPGALPEGTSIAIAQRDLSTIDMPFPAPELLNAIAAFELDLSGQKSDLPLQLALKLPLVVNPETGLAELPEAGTKVMFWRKGTIMDEFGVMQDTWWLVDDGVIDADGVARTSSPPYSGISGGGVYVVTNSKVSNNLTGEITVNSVTVNTEAFWSRQAFIAMAPSPTMAVAAIAMFAAQSDTFVFTYTLAGSFHRRLPSTALDLDNLRLSYPPAPVTPDHAPSISGMEFDPDSMKLTLTVNDLIPPDAYASQFEYKIWLQPRGDQMDGSTEVGVSPDRGLIWQGLVATVVGGNKLEITLPANVSLSQHYVHIERRALVYRDGFIERTEQYSLSSLASTWSSIPYRDNLVITRDAINVYRQGGDLTAIALVRSVKTDERGEPLNFVGYHTEQVTFNEDGTMAFIAGAGGRIYVFDTSMQRVVYTLHVEGGGANIVSMIANDGWLYVAEGQSTGASNGRLMRILIDQTSSEYMKVQQQLRVLGADTPYGYGDMAISMGRYLAVTSYKRPLGVINFPTPEAGNVYVIDLMAINQRGEVANNSVILDARKFSNNTGKAPQYITAGQNPGEFLLSSARDFNRGITAIKLSYGVDGTLQGQVNMLSTVLTPAQSDPLWFNKKMQENIQRAAGAVLTYYKGKLYALVADYNFIFNDTNYNNGTALGKQIGGKIGIIADPFGYEGEPRYLGATTPIVGGAIDHLSINQSGQLFADVFIEEVTEASSRMYKSLFVWSASALIQAALDHTAQYNLPLSKPIDRYPGTSDNLDGEQIPGVIPTRYDTLDATNNFGWIYSIGSYSFLNGIPDLAPIDLPDAPPVVERPERPKIGMLETILIRYGAESSMLMDGLYGSLRGALGMDTTKQIKSMEDARKVLNELKYEGDDLASNSAALALNVFETLASGFIDIPLQAIEGVSRVAAFLHIAQVEALKSVANGLRNFGLDDGMGLLDAVADISSVPPDMPILSSMGQAAAQGASMGDLLRMASIQTLSINPVAGGIIGLHDLSEAIKGGNPSDIMAAAFGVAMSGKQAKKAADDYASAVGGFLQSALDNPAGTARSYHFYQESRKAVVDAAQRSIKAAKEMAEKLKQLSYVDKKQSGEKLVEDGLNETRIMHPDDLVGTAVTTDQLTQRKWDLTRLETPRSLTAALDTAIENGAFDSWGVQGMRNLTEAEITSGIARDLNPQDVKVVTIKKDPALPAGPGNTKEIFIVVQDAAFFEKSKFATEGQGGNIAAAYQFSLVSSKENRISYDYVTNERSVIHVNRDMLSLDAGMTAALSHELFEMELIIRTLDDNVFQGRSMDRKILTQLVDRAHAKAVEKGDIAVAEQMVRELADDVVRREELIGEYFDLIRRMGREHEAAVKAKLEGQGLVDGADFISQVEYEIVDINRVDENNEYAVVGSRGVFDFLRKNVSENENSLRTVSIIEAKSTIVRKDLLEPDFKLSQILTKNQRENYPQITKEGYRVRPVGDKAVTLGLMGLLDENGFIKDLKPEIEFELRRYHDKTLGTFEPDKNRVVTFNAMNQELAEQVGTATDVVILTQAELLSELGAARGYWLALGVPAAMLDALEFGVANLPAGTAGIEHDGRILLDASGAGWGWYVDITPEQNEEFVFQGVEGRALAGSDAENRLDLLTVLIHEIGHALGLGDSYDRDHIMSAFLEPGIRRLPVASDLSPAFAGSGGQPSGSGVEGMKVYESGRSPVAGPASVVAQQLVSNPALVELVPLGTGWQTRGNVGFGNGTAMLSEMADSQTRLNQVFTVGPNDRFLSFTVRPQLGDQQSGPDDAFEVALLDAHTGAALLGTTGLTHNDALINRQADGTEHHASSVTRRDNADGSFTYMVDLSGIPVGTVLNLGFDLIGFGRGSDASNSQIVIRDLHLSSQLAQAVDDVVVLDEDTEVVVDVRANDIGEGLASLSPVLLSAPEYATVELTLDGQFRITPATDWSGTDSFTYALGDTGSTATVTFTVNPVNDAAVALAASVMTPEDTAVVIDLSALASDVDGDTLTFSIGTMPQHGVLTLVDGIVTYTPAADYHGSDSFSYLVSDGTVSTEALITLQVSAVNDVPAVQDVALVTDEDTAVVIDLAALASDVDGDALAFSIGTLPQHGVLALVNGIVTYTPAADYHGSDSFSYLVSDGTVSTEGWISLTVSQVNDAPVARDLTLTTAEDVALPLDLLAAVSDVDGDSLSIVSWTAPLLGTLTRHADGSFTYTPDADAHGEELFTYTVSDGSLSATATLRITVTPVNDAPVAPSLAVTAAEDSSVAVNLAALAFDVDGDVLTFSIGTPPQHGVLALVDGVVTYTPAADYFGADSFTYRVSDGLVTTEGVVTLEVTAVNDAPVAMPFTISTLEDTAVTFDPLAYVSDIDSSSLTVTVTAPAHGTLVRNPDGSYRYIPSAGYYGSDSFNYTVSDGELSSTAVVTVGITAVNHVPVANALVTSLLEDGSVVLDLLASASDADGDALTTAIVSGPAHGTLTRNADGSYRYVAHADYSGEDSFSWTASDGQATSQTALVRLVITAVADAPTLSFSDATGNASRELFRTGWESVADRDYSSTLVQQSTLDGWTLITRPDPTWGGANGFEVWSTADRMADNFGILRTVSAAAGNGKNWLELNSAGLSQSQTLGISRQVETVAGASYVLSFDYAGRVGYSTDYTRIGIYVDGVKIASYANTSPNSGLNWQALQFSFIGKGGAQSIRIVSEATCQDINGRGAMIDDIALTETLAANSGQEDTAIRLSTLHAALTDTDGSEVLTLAIEAIPAGAMLTDGVRSFTATAGQGRADITGWNLANLRLTPPADFHGQIPLLVVATATEQANGSASSTSAVLNVTVLPVNDAPVARDDSATVRANETVRLDVLANDIDVDGDDLATLLVSGPKKGTLVRNADGSFSYKGNNNFQGTDSFTYRVSDGSGQSGLATVTITVTAPNRLPVARNDSFSTQEDTPVRINVLANDTDADGDALTVQIVSTPKNGILTLQADGTYTYTPKKNWYGTDSFTYRVSDGMGQSSLATATISVAKVNDAPMALNAIYQLQKDGSVRIDFCDLVADVDGDALSLSLGSTAHGTLSRNWDGSYTYRPARGYSGLDSFTYTVSDGKLSSTGTVTLNVMGTGSGCYGSSASLLVQSRLLLGQDNGHLVYGNDDTVDMVADLSGNAAGFAVSWEAGQATVPGNPSGLSSVDEKWLRELLTTAGQIDLAAQTGLVVKVQRT